MQHSSTICILPLQTLTATATVIIPVPQGAKSFLGLLGCGTVTGTSPTLDVKIEQLIRKPVTVALGDAAGVPVTGLTSDYSNHLALGYGLFNTISSTNTVKQFAVSQTSGTNWYVAAQGNPSADNFRVGPIGAVWKVTFTVAGTSPSFANAYMVVTFEY